MPTIMTVHMRNTSGGEKASSTAPMSMPPMRASQAQASSVTPAGPAAATTRSRFTSASTLTAGVEQMGLTRDFRYGPIFSSL